MSEYDDPHLLLSKSDPGRSASNFIDLHYRDGDGRPMLLYAGDEFFAFDPERVRAYVPLETPRLRAEVREFLENGRRDVVRNDDHEEIDFAPTKRDVDEVIDALRGHAYTPQQAPAWLIDGPCPLYDRPDPRELIVARNGVFRLTGDGLAQLTHPTPRLFTVNVLDYNVPSHVAEPDTWFDFLAEIFDGDPESVALLQEWFGYSLVPDTSQQKILLGVGPTRAGKGVVARVQTAMLGAANICAPTLSGLASNFGMWPLINKRLAIISDARLSGRSDKATVVERLLSISGEDAQTIDRKNMQPWTGRLTTRLMILTNEYPALSDSSGALSNRFLIVPFKKSFLGREDTKLTDKLCTELPSILLWAVEGLLRLRDRGHFVQSSSGAAMRQELEDLASPINAFVREWCDVEAGAEVEVADLFAGWCAWCDEQGNTRHGTTATFGRDLRAAVPAIGTRQPRNDDGSRSRAYLGIGLTLTAREAAAAWKSRKNGDVARDGTRSYGEYA